MNGISLVKFLYKKNNFYKKFNQRNLCQLKRLENIDQKLM